MSNRKHSTEYWPAWSSLEDRLLLKLANSGKYSIEQIQDALERQCGLRRTVCAIRARLWRKKQSVVAPHMSATQVAYYAGTSQTKVLKWLRKGCIPAKRLCKKKGSVWIVQEEDVREFLKSYPYEVDPATIRKPSWKADVELARRMCPTFTYGEAAKRFGVSRTTIRRWVLEGRLCAVNIPTRSRRHRTRVVIVTRGGKDVRMS